MNRAPNPGDDSAGVPADRGDDDSGETGFFGPDFFGRMPASARPWFKWLQELSAAADLKTLEYAALCAKLRLRRIELAMARWQLDKDEPAFMAAMEECYNDESLRMPDLLRRSHPMQFRLETISKDFEKLALRVYEVNPDAIKAMVDIDMSGFGVAAEEADEKYGAQGIRALKQEVAECVEQALNAVHVPKEKALIAEAGDGALLMFDSARKAVEFGWHLHRRAKVHNDGFPTPTPMHFRVGIATGTVSVETRTTGHLRGLDPSGMAITHAVRLQSKCGVGGLAINSVTYDLLIKAEQEKFGPSEPIHGKRTEVIHGRRSLNAQSTPHMGEAGR